MTLSRALKILTLPALLSIYVGCSPVNFAKDNEVNYCQNFGQNCITQNGRDYFDYTVTAAGGLVDILIVDDNSASMSFEQTHLADRLSGFVQNLENQHADYRIAITTTDISASANNPPRAINQNGALQDGNLIQFPNGEYFLTNNSGTIDQKDQWFKSTVQRPETATCESFIRSHYGQSGYDAGYLANCPSGDERGVYAANLVVKNNPNGFIRSNAHLAIIFLSDEDERSQAYYYNTPGFELDNLDQPATLVSNVSSLYPGKLLSAHSIITTTQACLNTQNSQMVINGVSVVSGSYGLIYNQASTSTQGIVGDICASDYTGQLGQISTNILNRISSLSLACNNPSDLVVSISGQSGVTYSVSGKELKFNVQLSPGTAVELKYSCETL